MIKNLFDLENYDDSGKEVRSLIYYKNEFHPAIYEIIRKSIGQVIKPSLTFKANKIENTMLKSRKWTFKTIKWVF